MSLTSNPQDGQSETRARGFSQVVPMNPEVDATIETRFRDLYNKSSARLDDLFNGQLDFDDLEEQEQEPEIIVNKPVNANKRVVDEDNYDDSDDDDTAKDSASISELPPQSPVQGLAAVSGASVTSNNRNTPQLPSKGIEGARESLEEAKRQDEVMVRQSFNQMFFTLDNDMVTMLEQQRLEASERQLEMEMSGPDNAKSQAVGTLSQANLGTSSLVLSHLIARIDAKRELVKASDQELRSLMVEVRRNRSKWTSDTAINQEELYEAAEKVLADIKANTEHSQPFLTKVNKRDAPDYYNIIKEPMDLGLMTKKLKTLQYKSKREFVHDLNLIWSNCMKYNDKPGHFLRKHAEALERMSRRLIPLIPDLTVKSREEVEAEERRAALAENADDGGDDESDDEPIIASRGRKATSKKARKGASAPQAPDSKEDTLAAESKDGIINGAPGIRKEILRADSDTAMEDSINGGLSTPPPGTLTPAMNGLGPGAGAGSQADAMDIDNLNDSVHGALGQQEIDYDDHDHKTWKQVTKKDRATVTIERNRLFKNDKLNPEEPALLRSRAGMRRWLRRQRGTEESTILGKRKRDLSDDGEASKANETLAEGLEENEERILPDYYDTMSAIPDILPTLQWKEDSESYVVPSCEETLRLIPNGYFQSPHGTLSSRMAGNMRQVQETRKICAKIGVVKQMQLQTQLYQNQFQKYEPDPLVDQDAAPHVVSDDGPVMAPYICRAAMQRSVGKIFFNTGFEEYQPSAIDAMTDLATDFMIRLGRTLNDYLDRPKITVAVDASDKSSTETVMKSKHTLEEALLLSLNANGIDLEGLEAHAKDDAEKFATKLSTMHERMKAHLSDLLRPALSADAGPDGVNAFNDGSEQFVGGDFAEDLGEDFFGFKELGLDQEFGLASLSVPLHLLHNRMHRNFQAQSASATINAVASYPSPPTLDAVTSDNYKTEIGLLQPFLQQKLFKNQNQPLVEDEELPQKQRLPKPRLPPNGKITSPRKRPVKELGPGKGHPKKHMVLIEGEGWVHRNELAERERKAREAAEAAAATKEVESNKPGSKLKHAVSANDFDEDAAGEDDMDIVMGDGAKSKETNGFGDAGLISPESLEGP